MKVTLTATLLVAETRRYPYYSVRLLGARSRAQKGELEIPVRLSFDSSLVEQRTRTVELDVPTPEAPTLEHGHG